MDLSGNDLDSVTRTILGEAGENATPEVAIPRNLFADMLRMIAELRSLPVTSTS